MLPKKVIRLSHAGRDELWRRIAHGSMPSIAEAITLGLDAARPWGVALDMEQDEIVFVQPTVEDEQQ